MLDDASAFAGVVSVDCSPGGWNGMTDVSVDGSTVTVSFEPALPEASCCTVGLDCGAEVCVCGLEGDMDGDGTVTTGDASIIKPAFGTIPDAASAPFDMDLSGLITTGDFSVVKPRFGNTLPSPCP